MFRESLNEFWRYGFGTSLLFMPHPRPLSAPFLFSTSIKLARYPSMIFSRFSSFPKRDQYLDKRRENMSGCILTNKSHFQKKSIGWIWEMHRSLGSRKTYFYRDKKETKIYQKEKKQNLHDKANRIVLCLIDLSLFSIAMSCSTTKFHSCLIIKKFGLISEPSCISF